MSITVDGREVAIGPETDVRGTIEVGVGVEIDAVLTDDGIAARKVRVARTAADGPSEEGDSEDKDDGDKDEDDNSGSGSGGSDGDSSGSGSGGSYDSVLEATLVG